MQINPVKINWTSDENYFFINPRKKNTFDLSQDFPFKGHLLIATSGTVNQKYAAISKQAFLISARSVNQHLQASPKDQWLISLPLFHVGGLSILARCFLSSSSYVVFDKKWNPETFLKVLSESQASLTSLVPAQVYDLVSLKKKSPPKLRAIVVGGGVLHKNLYHQARDLGWPVLPSYGLTEISSQVATASLTSLEQKQYPHLQVLDHVQIQIQQKKIALKSQALLTGWLREAGTLENPLKKGWLVSEDEGEMSPKGLQVFGRDHFVKILGESVSLIHLENIFLKVLMELGLPRSGYVLLEMPHPRNGSQMCLVTSSKDFQHLPKIQKRFNEQVLPYERIKHSCFVLDFPQGNLFKIQKEKLKKSLGF